VFDRKHSPHLTSLAVLMALVSGCGGSGGGSTSASSMAQQGNNTSSADMREKALAGSSVTVLARASLASNVGAQMEVRVNGQVIGSVEVRSTSFQEYTFSTPAPVSNGARIDVVFTNDAYTGAEDRNLYVKSVTIDGKVTASTASGVTYDRGALDGIDVVPGQEDLLVNGGLRFIKSNNDRLMVRAKATLAGGVGPLMQVLVNGTAIAQVPVTGAQYLDYAFDVPQSLGAINQVDLVYSNDAVIGSEDRNLFIESVTADGVVKASNAQDVRYDRGALDGIDVVAGQETMLFNGALRFSFVSTAVPVWTALANENQAFSVNGTQTVRYGTDGAWVQKQVTGSGTCSNAFFGADPKPGTVKRCELLAAGSNPPPAPPPPAPVPTPPPAPTPPPPSVLGMLPANPRISDGVGVDRIQATTEQAFPSSDGTGDFRTRCTPSHFAFDDPIVYPGQSGQSHMHVFFGNTGSNANSTSESLRTTGNSTCRGGTINRSSYWVPTPRRTCPWSRTRAISTTRADTAALRHRRSSPCPKDCA
jgi:predicted xylan-binding protein with Ca-dependent carbohydrate-binding module/uncharacterized protein DUF1996